MAWLTQVDILHPFKRRSELKLSDSAQSVNCTSHLSSKEGCMNLLRCLSCYSKATGFVFASKP